MGEAFDLTQTPDGGFAVAGWGRTHLLRVAANGDSLWSAFWNEQYPDIVPFRILPAGNGGYVIGGAVDNNVMLMHTSADPTAVHEPMATLPTEMTLTAMPNPFNGATRLEFSLPNSARITLEVFDQLGRKEQTVLSGWYAAGVHVVNWECAACASGMYFLRLQAGERLLARRMVMVK
jgi:hypothetical protein